MKKILVTGGTIFVSKFVAEYYVKRGYEVYVLNRNNHKQVEGVHLIEGDRNALGDKLKGQNFDAMIDVNAYTRQDVEDLLDSGVHFTDYILISSSAVYPDYGVQPFAEDGELAENKFWGAYGTNKIEAEKSLFQRVPNAYVIRPPYLYGPYNNVYREAFVFECALKERAFYLPEQGEMKMQFFHVEDLCRMIDAILKEKPDTHIFNVGNEETISIREWVSLCYKVAGKNPEFVEVHADIPQRSYFSFSDYEYVLAVDRQKEWLSGTKPILEGLAESFRWYQENPEEVNRRPYIEYIDENF